MRKLGMEEQKLDRTLPGICDEKKSSRLLKVGRRSKDLSDSESFQALETEPQIKFSVEDESSVTFSVEDESSVMTNEGEESYESE